MPSKTATPPYKDGSWLVNRDPRFVTNAAAEEFIKQIHDARQKGFGFVPFVGAGFSAAAGAPLLDEIGSYLERCIAMGLGVDLDDKKSELMEPWNPRTDQWPPWIDAQRMKRAGFWSGRVHEEVAKSNSEEHPVFLQGAGATAEWRAGLTFLSRLDRKRREPGAREQNPARLVDPDHEVIDSCFREVLKGRHPSLCHRILGVLAGVLRLDLVLTTNFDDLLERGFTAARNPLEPFDMRLSGNLPPWSALSDVRSLIKLHGSRHSLRADYSLDAHPSENDKMRFVEYLVTRESRMELRKRKPPLFEVQNHLFVMGSKAEDGRTRELIEYAWRSLKPEFKVFWLCYSERDVRAIQDFTRDFKKDFKTSDSKADPEWQGSIILRYADFGLFLLQLYQMERKNLPPLGALFPSVSRLTLPPLQSNDDQNEGGKFFTALKKSIEARSGAHGRRLMVATEEGKARGVTSACAKVFRYFESANVCLWIDMNDISSADNLFEVLLEAAYFRLGLEHWTPVYMAEDQSRRREDQAAAVSAEDQSEHRSRTAELKRLVDSVNKDWIIFLNARETPGANTAEDDDAGSPHLWLDRRRHSGSSNSLSSDQTDCVEDFLDLVFELCKVDKISVVLLGRELDTAGEPPVLLKQLLAREKSLNLIKLRRDSGDHFPFSEDTVIRKAIEWTQSDPEMALARRRFLHALVLMQRPRLPSTIWSRALSSENHGKEIDWVNDLEKTGLVRRKAGGFIWIHSRSRQKLRRKLRDDRVRRDAKIGSCFKDWRPTDDEPAIHAALAEWYAKVLDVSEAPAAVFEVVYHFCKAAETYVWRNREEDVLLARESLGAAAALLKRSSFLVQTHGYSRGSCRRLEHIRDSLCKRIQDRSPDSLQQSIQRLRIVCTEVMRAIAREVGEDAKAYLRHRQFAMLVAEGKWTKELKEKCDERAGGHKLSQALHDTLADGRNDLEYVSNRQAEWLRWWRWSAMLGIASRSFQVAEKALERALRYVSEDNATYELPPGKFQIARLDFRRLAIAGMHETGSRTQSLRIEVLRLLVQYAEVLLLKDSALRRLENITPKADGAGVAARKEDPRDAVKRIEDCIEAARKGAAYIRAHDHSDDSRDTTRANWCESRLLMHASVCAARRVQLDFDVKGRQRQTAMALLGDAEASLRVSEPGRQRLELAMIELHRAEARLREAEAVPIRVRGPKSKGMAFAAFCRRLMDVEAIWSGETETAVGRLTPTPARDTVKEDLRRASSLVVDAIRFLNRAEPVLRERRRNVWWTTWFFERRLRSIALSVWASVFEKGAPIPFLGLEAAMRDTPTAADVLLDNARRMIRVDAYRLATIIDAYASCNKALQVRLALDSGSVGLPRRQESMREELKSSLKDLGQVKALREKRNDETWWTEMDDEVRDYVDQVIAQSARILEQLRDFRPS